jgi:kumamolisin
LLGFSAPIIGLPAQKGKQMFLLGRPQSGTFSSCLFNSDNIRWIPRTRLILCLLLLLMEPIFAAAQARSLLTRHVREVTLKERALFAGRLPAAHSMRLDIVLPLANPAGLRKFLQDLYDPSSSTYRHFLTVQEFTERFGPSQQDYDDVLRFATTNSFTVVGGSRDGMDVQLEGSVAAIEAAFHVTMGVYQHPTENRTFYAPDREPTVNLTVPLWHVSGLDNYSIPHPLSKRRTLTVQSNATSGSGPSASFLGSDMRAAYYGETALTGSGQNIGLLEYYGYDISDLNTYYANAGQTVTATISGVSTDGTSLSCLYASGCDDTEQIIDMTQALGMAPGISTLYVYVGSTDTAILGAMTTAKPLPAQLSSSWAWTPADPSVDDPYFERMAAQGQSFFQAAGDSDAWLSNNFTYPSEDPNVICVGGTDLTTSGPGGPWSSETGWVDGGGGISPDQIAIPSWQQLPGVINSSNEGSTLYRNGPDVSANSNFTFYVCANQTTCTANEYGGTSFAAPMWAGYMALANQQAAAQGDSAVGFVNPTLYPIGLSSSYNEDFHDITSGNNGFPAASGYDLITGWGSPNGANLINALAPISTIPSFTISPTALSVEQSGSGTSTITIATLGGFDAAIALKASGQPTGVAVSFSSALIPAPGSGVLTMLVTVPSTTAFGTYTFTVSGTGGGVTQMTTVSLSVIGATPPIFSPLPSGYSTPQLVTLTDNSSGVMIYYTTNGAMPTTASTPYTGPIPVSTTTTINAIAAGGGYGPSTVASGTYIITSPDLIETSFSVLTTAPVSGGPLSVSDTATNQGLVSASGSLTGFYLSTDGKTLGTLLKTRTVSTLAAGASSGPITTTITLPTNLNGTYYMIACANYNNSVVETSYSNNCTASAPMQVAGTDLIESSFSVLTTAPISGGSLSVSDTATNQGLGFAGTSQTGFYLSTDGKTLGTLLKTRTVSTLAAGASSGPITTTITLPTNLNGTYYMIACANYNNSVVETSYSNNCTASAPMQVAGTDLIESSFSVLTAAPISGGSLSVSDTATNQGFGVAGSSQTGFYLSTDGKTLSTLLKTRTVSTLASGASSGPVTTTITLPTNLNGTYYMIACANYNNSVVETSYSNNCTASAPMQVAGTN